MRIPRRTSINFKIGILLPWGAGYADEVSRILALFRSETDQWDSFWQRKLTNPTH